MISVPNPYRDAIAAPVGVAAARRALQQATSEADLLHTVTGLADTFGWIWHHSNDSRLATAGLPDLVMVRPPRVIFAELKKQDGRLRAEQGVWLEALQRCPGIEVFVWRPSDLAAIEEVLR